MQIMKTAAQLNDEIQAHIQGNASGPYVWHSSVYLHAPDANGCNWNVEINCKEGVIDFDVDIAAYLDDLRRRYVIPADDPTAVPAADAESRHEHRPA